MGRVRYGTRHCPRCEGNGVLVVDSRPAEIKGTVAVRRRLHCTRCDYRYTTYEVPGHVFDRLAPIKQYHVAIPFNYTLRS